MGEREPFCWRPSTIPLCNPQSTGSRLASATGWEFLAQYDYVSEAQLLHQPVDLVISFIPLASELGPPRCRSLPSSMRR